MKKLLAHMLVISLISCLTAGCVASPAETAPSASATKPSPAETEPIPSATVDNTPKTDSAKILQNIWTAFSDKERFFAYGGAVEHSVSDAPGDLDIKNAEELTTRYLLPKEMLSYIEEGASLVHMMSNTAFTGIALRLTENASIEDFSQAFRKNIRSNEWVCGQPDRLLMVDMGNRQLLTVFGSSQILDTFRDRLSGVYALANVLWDESLAA